MNWFCLYKSQVEVWIFNGDSAAKILVITKAEPETQIFFDLQLLIPSLTIFVGAKTKQSFGPKPPTIRDKKGLQNRCHSEPAWLRSF